MKKTITVLMMVLLASVLFVSCDNKAKEPDAKNYKVGDTGPAGGIIFYDCDADNDEKNDGAGADGLKSSVCGWRYLEAATANLDGTYTWGPKTSITGTTSQDIGKGKDNTETLKTNGIDAFPAAKACVEYSCGGYSDWFLPSVEEAKAMMSVSGLNVTVSSELWTSCEYYSTAAAIAPYNTSSGWYTGDGKDSQHSVRPVRMF